MGYFAKTLKGIGYMGALRAFMIGIAVIKVAILARILTPAKFGVYGIALLVLGLLEVLTETGINVFLIQEGENVKKYLSSAWVVSILRGALIALVIFLVSGPVSEFFKNQAALPLLYLTALVALARGFVNPMEVSFQKNLQFGKEFLFRSSLYIIDAAFAVFLGFLTKSESSMVISMLIAATIEVILSFVIFKDKPRFEIDKNKFLEVVNRGKWITGAGTFNYLFHNIDNIVIGSVLGVNPLGLYQQAYRISTLPVAQVGEVFNKVTFPVYVQMGNDKNRIKSAFLRTFLTILAISLPFALILLIFSRPLIMIFLGEKWLAAEPVLKVLAFFGIFKALATSTYGLFLSIKRQDIIMYSELLGIIGISASIFPLIHKFGLVGVGYSTIVGALASIPPLIIILPRILRNEKV